MHPEDGVEENTVQENSVPTKEMPKYKCHKEVWAQKIAKLEFQLANGEAVIVPAEEGYVSFVVDADYVKKHNPKVGGYYVVYADGYQSYSPAKAFEEGYSPI